MRTWINLFENEQSELYHGTNIEGLIGILWSDSLNEDAWDGAAPGASFTTSFEVARSFAEGTSRSRARHVSYEWKEDAEKPAVANFLDELEAMVDPQYGCGGAVMVFDRTLLASTHDLQDYSYSENSEEHEVRSMTGQEGKGTPPVTFALKRIEIFNPKTTNEFLNLIPTTLAYYNDYKADIDRAISIIRAKGNL